MTTLRTRRIAIALELDQPYPYHQQVFAGIQAYAKEHDHWRCLIDEHPGLLPKRRGPHYPRYDGVIARASPALQRRLKKMGVPLVNTHYQTARPGLPGVYTDPHHSGRVAAEHLIDRGFRRLGVMRDHEHKHSSAIGEGFVRCAVEREIPCEEVFFKERSYLEQQHWLGLERFLANWLESLRPPVGLLLEGSPEARLLIQLAQARGLHIPQDVAVLCFRNDLEIVEVSPQISGLDENTFRVGYEAARLLDRLIDGQPAPDQPILIPARGIIARESTDYFAIEDPVVVKALRYISARLSEPLDIERIAESAMVSTRSLQKHFSSALGRGVSEEIRRLRVEVAKRMLAEPEEPIGRIARHSGFSSMDLMDQVFRRELGMTPSGYRKQFLAEKAKARHL